jgi:hypothetical protein
MSRKVFVLTTTGLILVLAAVGMFSYFRWFQSSEKLARTETLESPQIEYYAARALPLFVEKKKLSEEFVKKLKIKDEQLFALLGHIPQWSVKSAQDIFEIEELNTYLDNRLSYYINRDEVQHSNDASLKLTMEKIRKIDESIEKTRVQLNLSALQSQRLAQGR